MEHKAFSIEVPDAHTAVLMVHGFFGSPHHFDMLLPLIPKEWSVYSILLDGHGGTPDDLARTSRQKWEEQVGREVARICGKYDRVIVVAHSMGCMLSANAVVAQGLEHKVAAMLFLGAALYPQCKLSFVRTALRMVYCKPKRDDLRTAAARRMCSIAVHKRIWKYLACIPRLLDLLALAGDTRKHISSYKLPMYAMQSYLDEVVKRKSIKPFENNTRAKAEFLMYSSHFYYSPKDERRICDAFAQIVADVRKKTQKLAEDN